MANKLLERSLAVGFITVCLFFGVGIGVAIRMGRLEASDGKTSPSDSLPILPPIQEEQIFQENITIQAVGDIIPGTNYPTHKLPRDRNQLIPQSVRKYLQRADILFGNFESSLTNHPYAAKDISKGNYFAFRSPPAYAKLFADTGFDVLNIANNHALDFGVVGFADTVKHLSAVGIETLGHKDQILLMDAKNQKVAMIGFAPYNKYNSIHDLKTAQGMVKTAKKKADIVVVSMHAGAEGTRALRVKNKTEFFGSENRGNSIKFARTMIDSGADLVIGHGPHVPRAMEIYKGKLIAYSLGNFLGYRTLSTKAQTGYSMILEVTLNSKGDLVGAKIIPVHMDRLGIPRIDKHFRTVGLVRYLISQDFPDNSVEINQRGELVLTE
ncbi:CapA family protein [Calothrix sp. 336/3]|uniref:CapA family protein n=1 Tax=Calothrix sp. 336/3 TaxID=1337936 RepID=UPI0004E31E0A|nr:CapA family protein [Calothrix sp. 336/3]AKG23222.1 metallophosphatase [Calothrix sp. 336/3]